MKNTLVSIIIPVYNVEKYLERCIDSVIKQQYREIEILLIDDGSTDKSGIICDRYRDIDGRIVVIHKENGGLSDARNYGINIAKGQYITFIDSDDLIDEEMISKLVHESESNDADLVICNYETFINESEIKREKDERKDILNSRECMLRYFNGKDYQCSIVIACGKLYRKDLWNDIKFPIGKLHEDEFTTYKLIYKAKKIIYVHRKMYFYRQNALSITGVKRNKRHLDILESFDNRIDFFCNLEDYEMADFFRAVEYVLTTKYYMILVSCISDDEREQLEYRIKQLKKKIFASKYIGICKLVKIEKKVIKFKLKKVLGRM